MNIKIKKYFKFSFVFFLLFIIIGINTPLHQAQAFLDIDIFTSLLNFLLSAPKALAEMIISILYLFLGIILVLILHAVSIVTYISVYFVDVALDPNIYKLVLESKTIHTGWTTVRNICNIFYIFFLLIIAFGTILRSKTLNAKSLLPKLIISLLLINFSAEITKMIIDIGQVFMYEIMNWMGSFSSKSVTSTSIIGKFKNELGNPWGFGFEEIVKVSFAIVYTVMLSLVYMMLCIFLLIRIVAFAILIILSPVAFLSIAMPSMSKYTKEWQEELIKYVSVGPIFLFFVYISSTLASETVTYISPVTLDSRISWFSSILILIIPTIIPLLMLVAAPMVASKLGTAGSKKLVGGTLGLGTMWQANRGLARKGWGLGKKAAGGVASRSSKVRNVIDSTKSLPKRITESNKIPGAAARKVKRMNKEEERKKEFTKNIKENSPEKIETAIAKDMLKARTSTIEDRVVAGRAIIYNGDLIMNETAIDQLMPELEKNLSEEELGKMEDTDLDFYMKRTKTKEGIKKMREADIDEKFQAEFSDTKTSLKRKEEITEEQARRNKVREMLDKGKDTSKLNLSDKTIKALNDVSSSGQQEKFKNNSSDKKRAQYTTGLKNKLFNTKEFKSATSDKQEEDLQLRIDTINFGEDLDDITNFGGTDAQIEKIMKGVNLKVIKEMSESDFKKHNKYLNTKQIIEVTKEGNIPTTEIEKVIIQLEGDGKQTEADKIKSALTGESVDSIINGGSRGSRRSKRRSP